eukprot:CAMPEP_0197623780 /NCGR_PEP_ID=MMETSP1338-20131121/3711_1 /TAXON_ID=43686 ORGANISM="Pelagodinium beii, Strain RCC1491" /NCGR_SAMPLE_ID=MMETSP1338 /ASSEMBLY_ACC=CAM_ASM_000754 /LENGTH=592 /DNA_ID=CAMNT_0043193855 /DNA_START=49 /DNA_END=1827 /DNA_ORIENTATION=+
MSLRLLLLAAVLCTVQGRLHSVTKPSTALDVDEPVYLALEDKSSPMFTKDTMPEVSPTLKCIINLTAQYFLIYTALAVVRTINQLREAKMTGLQQMLETACTTVTYAPMLSVLFLGTRMRAIQLAQGHTEKYGLPQWWVQDAMYACSGAVFVQVLVVLLIPVVTGDAAAKTDEDGNLDMSTSQAGGTLVTALSVIRYLLMLGLYGGFTTVIYGCFAMEGPKEIWDGNEPPVSPALFSTILLTSTFFGVYLLVALTKTAIELRGNSVFLQKLSSVLTLAKFTVNFAPMLAILFIGARMRALQMDPKNGNPQRWAQCCFYLCTASLVVQTLMVVLMPICTECEVKQGSVEGDVEFEVEDESVRIVLTVVRYLALAAMYTGFSAVVASVFLITHPEDPALTPPLSTAMLCTMNLSVQYFGVYLGLFLCNTAKQCFSGPFVGKLMAIFEAGQKTVMFAPMLSILFWAARMRALQLAKTEDGTIPTTAGPPYWAQDAMFLATWSVLIQLIMAMVLPALSDENIQMDENGAVKPPQSTSWAVTATFEGIRYFSLVSMYGGSTAVMASMFLMTPESIPPYSDSVGYVPPPPSVPTPTAF